MQFLSINRNLQRRCIAKNHLAGSDIISKMITGFMIRPTVKKTVGRKIPETSERVNFDRVSKRPADLGILVFHAPSELPVYRPVHENI